MHDTFWERGLRDVINSRMQILRSKQLCWYTIIGMDIIDVPGYTEQGDAHYLIAK